MNIKSTIWANDHLIYYSTVNHIKYFLLNGDGGIVKCTDKMVYLT
jgi:coatomer protein complex subunit alpha (xenin)